MTRESELLRSLPKIDRFLGGSAGVGLAERFGSGLVKMHLREELERLRVGIRDGTVVEVPDEAALAAAVGTACAQVADPAGRTAINATGILLHTGLGRAPLCAEAVTALARLDGYSVLQTDPETGKRSLREEKIERLLQTLTGCEAATVVNNNAAATMLVLSTLCAGREAIVSRGQLIEIGGAYRIPDVLVQSGCTLREIGTTNRTHLRDYAAAIGEETGVVLHVHTSNYRIRGFCGTPTIGPLCDLGRERQVPVLDDLGSGALVPLAPFGIEDEPLVADSIAAGASAACFSGDKLICGPQSGIICGDAEVIARIRKNPFARMFRVGKLTLAALEATLVHFVNGTWREAVPFYRHLGRPLEEVSRLAEDLLAALPAHRAHTADDVSYIGSGSIPDQGVPTRTVVLPGAGTEAVARRLRCGTPAVFARQTGGNLVLDPRTVFDHELDALAHRVSGCLDR